MTSATINANNANNGTEADVQLQINADLRSALIGLMRQLALNAPLFVSCAGTVSEWSGLV